MDNPETAATITTLPMGIIAMIIRNLDVKSFLAFCSTCSHYRKDCYIKFYETLVRKLFPKYNSHPSRLEEACGRPYLETNVLWRQRLILLKEKAKQSVIKPGEEPEEPEYIRIVTVHDTLADFMRLEHYGIKDRCINLRLIDIFVSTYIGVMTLSNQTEQLSANLKRLFFAPVGERSRFSHGVEDTIDWNDFAEINIQCMIMTKFMFQLENMWENGKRVKKESEIREDYSKYISFMCSFKKCIEDTVDSDLNGEPPTTGREEIIKSVQRRWTDNGFSM